MGKLTTAQAEYEKLGLEYNRLLLQGSSRDAAGERRFAEMPGLLQTAQSEYEAARAEADAVIGEANAASAEDIEFSGLHRRASLVRMVENLASGRAHDGAEAEFQAAVFDKPAHNQFPIHLLLPSGGDGDGQRGWEVRADAVVSAVANSGPAIAEPIMGRIFAQTDAAYLGATFRTVPGGEARFPYLKTGAGLSYADAGQLVDAAASEIGVVESTPRGATAAYRLRRDLTQLFPAQEVEDMLRRDLSAVVTDGIDATAIAGRAASGSAPTFSPAIPGLYGALTAGTDASDVVTLAALMGIFAGRVDGIYARSWDEVRVLMRPEPYAVLAAAAVSAANESLAGRLIEPGRVRASSRLPAPASNLSQCISYAPMQNYSDWVIPTWEVMQIITDEQSLASSREIRLTVVSFHDVQVIRDDCWQRHSLKDA